MTKSFQPVGLDQLVALIEDGDQVAVPPEYSYVAMAATRALIQRGVKDLRLLCVPQAGFQVDILIGASCVASVETAAVTLGEFGLAPRFTEAALAGEIEVRDSTCPAIHAALQASEKGVPFMPLRGLIGSDLLAHRDDWRVIDNPFETGDPIVVLPAIAPDVALFHAPLADSEGNVWIGRRRELAIVAHAARKTLFTVEKVIEGSLFEREETAACALPAFYVEAVAEAPRGCWPLGLAEHYEADRKALSRYVEMAQTREGFAEWLDGFLGKRRAA